MAYFINFRVIQPYIPGFFEGLGVGLWLAAISLAFGMLIGMLLAFCAVSKSRVLKWISSTYVTILRNIPLLVFIFLCYFGLPDVGILLSKKASFVVALSLYAGAYLTEVFRSGLQSISRGIVEAGMAIGLRRIQIMCTIQLPIMFRNVLPSLSNTFISLFKDTALASSIAIPELTYLARKANTITFRVIEVWLVVGCLYMITCYAIAQLLRLIERKLQIK